MIAATFIPATSSENTPGLAVVTGICTPELDWPKRVGRTVSVTRVPDNWAGNCASICVADVLIRGIDTSFAVTQTPPRTRGSGAEPALSGSARFVPRIVIREPGETCRERLAVFRTPPALNEGMRPPAGANDTTLRPETVSRYTLLLPSATMARGRMCVWLFTPSSSALARGGH